MSHTWKLLPLAALFALGLFLVSGAGNHTPSARAEISSIDIDPELVGGDNEVTVTVVSQDDSGTLTITVAGGSNIDIDDTQCTNCDAADIDENADNVVIDTEGLDVDTTQETMTTTFTLQIECEDGEDITITASEAPDGDTDVATFECGAAVTPTVTVTTTPVAAATVTGSANPTSVACGQTSIISFIVKTASGAVVPAGTTMKFTTTLGTISPTTGTTAASDGSVFVFFTAPSNQGGTATITGEAPNGVKGTVTVQVNCGQAQATATSTTAPPPTVAATATPAPIRPPSTGDAGLDEGRGWTPYAGIALIVGSILGALALVRVRA